MTKKTGMSAKDRRALTLGLVVLLPSLFYVFGVRRYVAAVSDTRAHVTDERNRLSQHLAAITAARQNPRLQQVADSSMRAMTPRLFSARDLIGAELVSLITDVADRNEVLLRVSTTQKASVDANGVRKLTVDIQAESDLQGLLGFLESLERGDKLLRVEKLRVTRINAKADAEGVQPMSINASISGFAIREGPATPDELKTTTPATGRGAR